MALIDTLKTAGDLALKYQHIDIYEQIMSLREEVLSIREESLSLRDENKKLNDTLQDKQDVIRDRNAYYLKSDTSRTNPYCMTCLDVNGRLVSLTHTRFVPEGETELQPGAVCHYCESR